MAETKQGRPIGRPWRCSGPCWLRFAGQLLGVGALGDGNVDYREATFYGGILFDLQANEGTNLVVEQVDNILAFLGVAKASQPVGQHALGAGALTESLGLWAEFHQFQARLRCCG